MVKKMQKGFTLIELMIVVVIIGILTMVVLPTYQSYIIRTKRLDATTALMDASNTIERYRANNFSYAGADLATSTAFSDERFSSYYTFDQKVTATTYIITATAIGKQKDALQDAEILSIDQHGVKRWVNNGVTKSCWPANSITC
ncbi:MAG: prepilin-type N-terminal cleavage/methylation domain-containing protein [Gammaproteobacteria bacterium]|nr:prepilin-type N-terminal cleavage/methylation domain-containing protein [Gammaproteobacteria bacterium]